MFGAHSCLALAAMVLVGAIRAQELPPAPVEYIDHIMIRSDDPDELIALFSGIFSYRRPGPLLTAAGS